jgi:TolB-like protein
LCHVKNIAEPIRVYAAAGLTGESHSRRPSPGHRRAWRVAIAATGALAVIGVLLVWAPDWLQGTSRVVVTEIDSAADSVSARVGKPTIAVLPFSDQSDAGGQDYFSDGVTEDIIRALGRFSGLLVLSWNAVAPFKGQAVALDELGEQLGARYVVGGTIRRSGDQLRVSVELTDMQRGVLLWSERFDDRLKDIFAVQDRITQQVVAALAGRVRWLEQAEALAKPTESLGAYDLVLRGRSLLRRVERSANFDARSFFERAIAIDSSYADAHVGLGWTYLNDFLWGWTQWPHRAVEEADRSARHAIELDDRNAAAHALRAFIFIFHRAFEAAETAIDRALELNPNDAMSHAIRGDVMVYGGRPEEAIEPLETALQLDPHPLAWWLVDLGQAYYLEGRYADVVALFDRFTGDFTEDPGPHAILAAAHAQLGEIEAASAAAEQLRRGSPFFDSESYASGIAGAEHQRHLLDGFRKAGL